MYRIAVLVAVFFLILLCLARKEDVPRGTGTLMKPFLKMSVYLYRKVELYFPRILASRRIENHLCRLHPGESGRVLVAEYWEKKMALCLAVVAVGTLFGIAAKASAGSSLVLGENGVVERGDYYEDVKEAAIYADYAGNRVELFLEIEPRRLTEAEIEGVFDKFEKALPELVLGTNADLQNIRSDLLLSDAYEGFPIVVDWKSNRPDVMSSSGKVKTVEVATQVLLTVEMSYGGYCRETNMVVAVRPPLLTKEEELRKELEKMLALSAEEAAEQREWQLPAEWKGEGISWGQKVKDNGLVIWLAAIIVAVLLYFCTDRDLGETLEKRNARMRHEYPEIVHKLVLFMGAGMTLRGSFRKLAKDYENKTEKEESPAYEEIVFSCNELSSGISEGTVYERFGKRIGLQEYIRLGTLLTQNLKRGSSTLLERLKEEADKASQEQLQQARKAGEEAGTKLLVPMVLQLAVVMVMIMVPVFLSM